ncbi:MAG: hypothetical protein H7320_03155 [Ferruginibacter sp.]|nr:hypothetical protein [Ferruginibacter sp.]
MKIIILFFLFAFTTGIVTAQKQTYYLFAHTKKKTVQICGEKELINSSEVSLTAEEAATYKQKYLEQLKTKYNGTTGYDLVNVELARPGQIVIIYEGEKTYDQRRDGWNCTSTFYGCKMGSDALTAEKNFAALQNEFKYSVFREIKRWGSPALQSVKEDDLEIRWKKTSQGIIAFFKNTKTDGALKIKISGFKKKSGNAMNTKLEGVPDNSEKTEETTIELQPGATANINLRNADEFNIDIGAAPLTNEKQGIIDNIKHIIRHYVTEPGKPGNIKLSAIGPRG